MGSEVLPPIPVWHSFYASSWLTTIFQDIDIPTISHTVEQPNMLMWTLSRLPIPHQQTGEDTEKVHVWCPHIDKDIEGAAERCGGCQMMETPN